MIVEAIERVSGGNAGLASSTAIQRNLEGILLARAGLGERNQAAVMIGEIGFASVMDLREARDRSLELLLFGEELIDEIALLKVRL